MACRPLQLPFPLPCIGGGSGVLLAQPMQQGTESCAISASWVARGLHATTAAWWLGEGLCRWCCLAGVGMCAAGAGAVCHQHSLHGRKGPQGSHTWSVWSTQPLATPKLDRSVVQFTELQLSK